MWAMIVALLCSLAGWVSSEPACEAYLLDEGFSVETPTTSTDALIKGGGAGLIKGGGAG